jgi:PAS domain-containing protein
LPEIESTIATVIDFEGFAIAEYDSEKETGRAIYARGVYKHTRTFNDEFHISESAAGHSMESGRIDNSSYATIDELQDFPRSVGAFEAGARSFLTIPLLANDDVIGVIQLRSKSENAYSESDIDVAGRVANQISSAFANSLAIERIRLQATALESADTAIVIANPEGIIEWVNPAFITLSGWTAQEAIGQRVSIMRVDSAVGQVIEKTAFAGGPFVKKFEEEGSLHQKNGPLLRPCLSGLMNTL